MNGMNTAVLTDVVHWNRPRRYTSRVDAMRTKPGLDVMDPLAAGREALSRGEWEQALACFEAASETDHSAEAIEALAMAAWWLDNKQLAIESREHAYRLYRERGDAAGAARMAIWLGWDSLAFRGEPAVARGWLQRAHRLLDGLDPVPEHGWLALREGEFAFLLNNDLAATGRFAQQARSIGTALAVPGIEFSALGLEGLALASQGNIADGIRLLDEASAAAMGGEMSELWAAGRTCCYMITACERVRDLERAYQWSQRMLEFAKRWRIQDLFAVCRAHYGGILVLRGTWEEADATFETAIRELRASRPGIAFEALVRRADLRRRQGRFEEAAELFGQAEFHPYAQLGLAHVALDSGDVALAADRARRFLRKLSPDNLLQRAAGLDLYARVLVALGETERARTAHDELQSVVAQVGSDSLRASALAVDGLMAEAEGDLDMARSRIEDAIDLFDQCGDPFETARSRLDLARVLAALGRSDPAAEQARVAHQALARMQADREAQPADALTSELGDPASAEATSVLTPRELDVLKLVAQGLSNTGIAQRLILSEHTVHRHLANILHKLGLSSRAAAAAWGVRTRLV
jgi:LuxR family transcriptional regulator, maltose regulon positive regulatory protein